MTRTKVRRILLAALLLPMCAHAQIPIGRVLLTKGDVQARDVNGSLRALSRRDSIFEHEAVLVSTDGYASLRMIDDSQLAFGSNTEFRFDSYRMDGDPTTGDAAVMSLARGCFRAVSGSIGGGLDNHRIDTPFASINIRGTFHVAAINGDALYTGTLDGGTTVANSKGAVDLGSGGTARFSRTRSGVAPEGLNNEPAELGCSDNEGTDDDQD